MIFRSLASSSAGNAYMVSDGDTTLMLECGMSYRKLQSKAAYMLQTVSACFVTHHHADHAAAAGQLIRHGIPVYMSEGAARALDLQEAEIVELGKTVRIGDFRILPFRVWHDCPQPVGYLIDDTRTRERLLFAADTRNLDWAPDGLTHIAVECNYDEQQLAASIRINDKLRERIRHTHMEVGDCIRYLHKLDLSRCLHIYLIHLSDHHSDAQAWEHRFRREFPGIDIQICPK